ncbi:hypothetical protein [Chelativorans alearense]|uniref:hypothetical protein n=1 Tax=Chelativorans alearense TaxID=2681495 RepID=UPI001FED1020|nr:hypothetical protein [Chelativorans alearense]
MARNISKLVLAALIAGTATVAAAQPLRCGQRGNMVEFLGERFQERQHGYGVVGNKAIVELFLSPKGSWTILMTGPDRQTCIVAAGDGWEDVPTVAGHDVTWRAPD